MSTAELLDYVYEVDLCIALVLVVLLAVYLLRGSK